MGHALIAPLRIGLQRDVSALVVALGGRPGTDVIDLLEQRCSGDAAYNLGAAIRSSGVK